MSTRCVACSGLNLRRSLLRELTPLGARAEPRRLRPGAAAGLRLAHGAQAGAAPRGRLHLHRGPQPAGACLWGLARAGAGALTCARPQLRMMQGDSWDEPTLLPTQGAALDVRARVSVRLRAVLTRRRRSCCRPPRIRTRQPPVSLPSSCTSARTRCVRSRRVCSCRAAHSQPARCAPRSRSCCGRRKDGACSRDRKSGSSRCGTVCACGPPQRCPSLTRGSAGTSFNFETILQAHDTAIRALVWSHNENWLISGAQQRCCTRPAALTTVYA